MNKPRRSLTAVAIVLLGLAGGVLLERYAGPKTPTVETAPATVTSAPPSTIGPTHSTLLRSHLYRATLDQVARDFGIQGRLDCRAVPR